MQLVAPRGPHRRLQPLVDEINSCAGGVSALSDEELAEKFRDVTGGVLSPEKAEEIMAAAMTIHTRKEIASFTEMLHI